MWITAEYEATTLFSLKPVTATASGGKTLLVPTPFAIKMALLDVACQTEGLAVAQKAWQWLSSTSVALRPAEAVVVNHTFIKILKPRRNPAAPGSADAGHFGRTIAYREYAQLHGPFAIGLEVADQVHTRQLESWLLHVNYLGKRGSFIQITGMPRTTEQLPEQFITVDAQLSSVSVEAVLTQLDDVGDKVSFDHVNIYSGKGMILGKHRVLRHVALPYRLASSSRGYSHYERLKP